MIERRRFMVTLTARDGRSEIRQTSCRETARGWCDEFAARGGSGFSFDRVGGSFAYRATADETERRNLTI